MKIRPIVIILYSAFKRLILDSHVFCAALTLTLHTQEQALEFHLEDGFMRWYIVTSLHITSHHFTSLLHITTHEMMHNEMKRNDETLKQARV